MISVDLSIITEALRAALVRTRNAEVSRGGPPLTNAEARLWYRLAADPVTGITMTQLELLGFIEHQGGGWMTTSAGKQAVRLLADADALSDPDVAKS